MCLEPISVPAGHWAHEDARPHSTGDQILAGYAGCIDAGGFGSGLVAMISVGEYDACTSFPYSPTACVTETSEGND